MHTTLRLSTFIVVLAVASATFGGNYTFTKVIDSESPLVDSLGYPSISGGRVAFANTSESFPDTIAVYTGDGGPLATIAKRDDPAPWGSFVTFDAALARPSISSGQVAFSGSGFGGAPGGVFVSDGASLATIVKSGDPAPVGTFSLVGGLDSEGQHVLFHGSYDDANNRTGLFTGSGGPLTAIVKSGDPAPVGTFDRADRATLSGATVAFKGHYNGLTGHGVFTGSGGSLTTIAKQGDPAPIGHFADLASDHYSPSLDGDTVAFYARYDGDGSFGQGIFTGSGGPLTTVVKSGDPAPIGGFLDFRGAVIKGGAIAFAAGYNFTPSNLHEDSGIFLSQGGLITPVIKTGDPLFGGVFETSVAFDLDEQGNIAFLYALVDGRYGIAIAHPVPEPRALALLTLAVAGLATRRQTI